MRALSGLSVGRRAGRTARTAVAVLSLTVLGACAVPSEPFTEDELARGHQFRPPYQVERTVHEHLVPVSATKILIDEEQFRDLYGFLIGVGARTGDAVVLASRRSRLEHRAQVEEFLRRVGLRPETKLIKDPDAGAEDDGYGQAILVRFDRYTTRPYQCGNWKEDLRTNFHNTSSENFGCATTSALQQQVAYPSSLIEGSLLDFPEGDVAAEAVSRYRGRKVEAIKAESPTGG